MRGRSEREGEEEESKVAHDEEFIRGVVKESHGFEGRADRGRVIRRLGQLGQPQRKAIVYADGIGWLMSGFVLWVGSEVCLRLHTLLNALFNPLLRMDCRCSLAVRVAVEHRVYWIEVGRSVCGALYFFDAALWDRAGDLVANCFADKGSLATGKDGVDALGLCGAADSGAISEWVCLVAAAGASGGDTELDCISPAAVYGGIRRRGAG